LQRFIKRLSLECWTYLEEPQPLINITVVRHLQMPDRENGVDMLETFETTGQITHRNTMTVKTVN
jgi:hypothetical protein